MAEPLKILSVIASADVGGAETHVGHVVAHVPGKHYVVTLADGPMVARWRAAGADVYVLPVEEKIPLGAKTDMERLVRSIVPDIVHSHTPKANFLVSMCSIRRPFVMTVHGSHRQFASSRLLPAAWYKWADLWAARRAACVIAVCEADRRELVEGGFGRHRVRLVPNGVPDPGVFPAIVERPWEKRDVVWIGRFSPEKRPDLMIEIAKQASCHPLIRRIRMIGDGELAARFRSTVLSGLSVEPAVPDLRPVWNDASLLLNTSSSEGASLVLLESLAAGIPAVASASGGNTEILASAGFTVRDAGSFSETAGVFLSVIKKLLEDPQYWREQSALARKRFDERYHVKAMADTLGDLYREVVFRSGIP